MVDLIDYIFFFTFFHAVSSLSQDSLTQSSSVLSPFDPFLAIGRSYTTCFRSKKVRNTERHPTETKRNRGGGERGGGRLGSGTRDPGPPASETRDSRIKLNIQGSNMNTNGWIIARNNCGRVSAFLSTRYGFFHVVTVQVLCYNK